MKPTEVLQQKEDARPAQLKSCKYAWQQIQSKKLATIFFKHMQGIVLSSQHLQFIFVEIDKYFLTIILDISIVQRQEISRVQNLEISRLFTLEIYRRCTIEISRNKKEMKQAQM